MRRVLTAPAFACLIGAVLLTAESGLIGDPEPAAAAGFIGAHAGGDRAALARVSSPLLRYELARLGEDPLRPLSWWRDAVDRLDFAYAGAVADGWGFTHALYVARTRRVADGGRTTSVWRIDLDGHGRVVWAEMVRVFAPGTRDARAVRTRDVAAVLDAADPAVTEQIGTRQPVTLLGVRSSEGEGYYAVGLAAPDHGGPAGVVFVASDRDGVLFPGAWSYGRAQSVVAVDAPDELRAYLAALSGCAT